MFHRTHTFTFQKSKERVTEPTRGNLKISLPVCGHTLTTSSLVTQSYLLQNNATKAKFFNYLQAELRLTMISNSTNTN